jgi:hypothetical protein
MMQQVLKVTCIAGLLSLALAASVGAGQYHVYSCRMPSGAVAPVDGWSGSAGPVYDDYATNTCGSGGALTAALGEQTPHFAGIDQATWTLGVPAGETMTGATLWRAGDADGGEVTNATYEFWLAAPSESSIFDDCVYQFKCPIGVGDPAQPLSAANRVVVPSANLGSHLYAVAACGGSKEFECPSGHGDLNGYAAVVYVYAADVLLEQSGGPSAREVSGPLATEKSVQGTSDLVFNASDPGAGVWETVFSVDGRVVQSTVPNDFGGHCRNVGQTTDGMPAFLYLQPCPQTEGADVGFDTTAVGNGAHHLVVSVLDAAGNSAPVLDKEIDVENPAATLPSGPGSTVGHSVTRRPRARLTLRIEPHKVSLRQSIHFEGRLLGGHIPKIGKLLVLEARLLGGGTSRGRRHSGKWFGFDEVRTGRQGRFHGSYRFNVFVGPGDYQLRVLAKAETGYPFATGWSRAVRVRVT